MRPIRIFIGLLFAMLFTSTGNGQVTYYDDSFNGGVVTGGFSLGTAGFGTGNFTINIPAGSTIRQAYLFGTSVTDPGAYTIDLNGTAYTFDNTNLIQTFNSGIGLASIHAIDVSAGINTTTTAYSIQANFNNQVSEFYSEFYLYITYDNPALPSMNAVIFVNDQDIQGTQNFTLTPAVPFSSNVPVGLALVGGYADGNFPAVDCQEVAVNGISLGSYYGPDNNAASDMGAMGSFWYRDVILNGTGDDNSDQAIDGADVVSNLQSILPTVSDSLVLTLTHCTPGNTNNITWLMLLSYADDTCSTRTVGLGKDTSYCNGQSLTLQGQINNATYQWSDGSTGQSLSVTSAGTYTVTATINSCSYSDTIVVSPLSPPFIDLGDNVTPCEGTPVNLDASIGHTMTNFTSYQWSDGSSGPNKTFFSSGEYIVTVTENGCINSDTIEITYQFPPALTLPGDTVLCNRSSYQVNLPSGNQYMWNDGSTSAIRELNQSGLYSITATNTCGSDTTTMNVSQEECDCVLYFPNAFSPNGDDLNDTFGPETECDLAGYGLYIFNRWGEPVFETRSVEDKWDGTKDGKALPAGVYSYYYQYVSPFTKKMEKKAGSFLMIDE